MQPRGEFERGSEGQIVPELGVLSRTVKGIQNTPSSATCSWLDGSRPAAACTCRTSS
eukprot:SAG22_NODE_15086_length_357_cov_1.003876_1_plen_56_part_01